MSKARRPMGSVLADIFPLSRKRLVSVLSRVEGPLVEYWYAGYDVQTYEGHERHWLWCGSFLNGSPRIQWNHYGGRRNVMVRPLLFCTYRVPVPGTAITRMCDEPACVNPWHAEPTLCSERNPNAKLTDAQCRELYAKYKTGGYSQRQLAREYGVSPGQVCRIVTGAQRGVLGLEPIHFKRGRRIQPPEKST